MCRSYMRRQNGSFLRHMQCVHVIRLYLITFEVMWITLSSKITANCVDLSFLCLRF